MTREEIEEWRKKDSWFRAQPIGKAYYRMVNAIIQQARLSGDESDKLMRQRADDENATVAEFKKLLFELMEKA